MFASIRHYRLTYGSMNELTRRVDLGFAELVSALPGFVSYEFIDCGDGEIVTVSVFGEAQQAEASSELARRWTVESLRGFDFVRLDQTRGEVKVSRASLDMLEPTHGRDGKFASLRHYVMREDTVPEVLRLADELLADELELLDGFEAYHVIDCGGGKILSISLFRDQAAAEESDEAALVFVRNRLATFGIERTEILGGDVVVSRAAAKVLEPAHA
jgi:hypothetical protein